MRPGLVRNVGLGISAVALVWLAACDDNPLSFDVKEGTGIFVNPSEMVVPAGRTGKLESRTVNPANQSTFQEIAWAIDPTCGSGAITVTDDPDEAERLVRRLSSVRWPREVKRLWRDSRDLMLETIAARRRAIETEE